MILLSADVRVRGASLNAACSDSTDPLCRPSPADVSRSATLSGIWSCSAVGKGVGRYRVIELGTGCGHSGEFGRVGSRICEEESPPLQTQAVRRAVLPAAQSAPAGEAALRLQLGLRDMILRT